MEFLERIYERAKKDKKKILFPEAGDERILKAAEEILKSGICVPVIIGNPDTALGVAKKYGIDLKGVEIIDSINSKDINKYVELYCELRKHKKIKQEDAQKI